MKNNKTIKLILYYDLKMVKTIEEPNTVDGLKKIIEFAEEWKRKDKDLNTINISFENNISKEKKYI